MGLTFSFVDPETGASYRLTAYRRNGRLVIQRLPPHLFREGLTPLRAEVMARFSEAASRAFDSRQTGHLPPAAEKVREEFARDYRDLPRPAEPGLESPGRRYRLLLGSEAVERLDRLLRVIEPEGPPGDHEPSKRRPRSVP